jgi:uncharacterized protein (DUF488 family)
MNHVMPKHVFTIGHSKLLLEQFVGLLSRHRIETLVDIRRFPSSRKYPHFNEKSLAAALREAGIDYRWMEALGGRRPKRKGFVSPNEGLDNEGFRNYADYMLTDEFREAVKELLAIAGRKRTAIMCAESVYWRCHRRLVSDFLSANGVAVQHIFPSGEVRPHQPTPGAKFGAGQVTYPAEQKSLFE